MLRNRVIMFDDTGAITSAGEVISPAYRLVDGISSWLGRETMTTSLN